MDASEALRLFGTDEPVAAPRRLAAGALTCELDGGELRHVRWGDVEIIRGIAYLLRDDAWGTVPTALTELVIDETAAGFTVDCTLTMRLPEAILAAHAHIEGHADGRLLFTVRAEPDRPLRTNRCGFVVLHPSECAGRALRVEHTSGAVHDTRFPTAISPGQPVLDIRSLAWSPAPGVALECRLSAALPHDPAGRFEMEDQRNWSDASFKTYVASLLDPWPYVLPAERALEQCVSLAVRGDAPPARTSGRSARALRIGAVTAVTMPAIGVGVPPGIVGATRFEHDMLRALDAAWWLVDATLDDGAFDTDLAAVAALREGCEARIQLDAVVPEALSPDEAARRLARACVRARLRPDAVRLLPAPYLKSYQPSAAWPALPPLDAYARATHVHFPDARIGGGMFTNFTELNRMRPSAEGLHFIGHLTCPIVHAADDGSVMATMRALPAIVRSVRALWPGLDYHLGPVTLAPLRNPYGDVPTPNPLLHRLALADVDPRQRALFGAAWTLAYAAAVAGEGVAVLALHHSHGHNGPATAGEAAGPVPAWSVLRALAGAAGAKRVAIEAAGTDVCALGWSHDGRHVEGLAGNLTASPVELDWSGDRADDLPRALSAYEVAPFRTPLR